MSRENIPVFHALHISKYFASGNMGNTRVLVHGRVILLNEMVR